MNEKKSNRLNQALSARGVRSVVTAVIGFLILFVVFAVASPSFRSGNNIGTCSP